MRSIRIGVVVRTVLGCAASLGTLRCRSLSKRCRVNYSLRVTLLQSQLTWALGADFWVLTKWKRCWYQMAVKWSIDRRCLAATFWTSLLCSGPDRLPARCLVTRTLQRPAVQDQAWPGSTRIHSTRGILDWILMPRRRPSRADSPSNWLASLVKKKKNPVTVFFLHIIHGYCYLILNCKIFDFSSILRHIPFLDTSILKSQNVYN